MFEMTNENVARLLRGLTIAVGSRKNRILIYQFLAAEIRALHYSYSLRIAEIVIMSNPPKPAERKRRQHTTTTKAAMPAAVHPRRPPQRQKLTRDELQQMFGASSCLTGRHSKVHLHRSIPSRRWSTRKPSGANGAIGVPELDPGRTQSSGIDVSKITCEQLVQYKITNDDSVMIWLSGYYNGKRGNTIVDPQVFKENAKKIRPYCILNSNVTVMQAVETVLGK